MRIILARHTQTNYNELDLCNSDPSVDVYLTERGIIQAQELAASLRVAAFEQAYASELRRTQQTVGFINRYHHVGVRVDRRLNDNRTGYEGRPAVEYYAALEAAPDKWTARFNDGESWEDVKQRVQSFLDDLEAQNFDLVLIVTSMVIIQIMCGLVRHLTNQQALEFDLEQGSYLELAL